MPLTIPKRDSAGIARIIGLSGESVELLVKALISAPSLANSDTMVKYIFSDIPSISVEELTNIINTLYSIYRVREFSGVSPSRFLDDLVEGISSSTHAELSINNIDFDEVKKRFGKLLSIDTLKVIAKAARLQADGERFYCSSKILSDIRPVFDDEDPSARPFGAVITHTLKIVHHVGKNLEEFHVILDSHELDLLMKIIMRASIKDKTLRALMEDANLKDLGV